MHKTNKALGLGLKVWLCLGLLLAPVLPAFAAATISTTTTLTTSANTAAVGTPVTLTATVVAASGAGPTGTVTFKKGATTVGTATLSGTGLTRTATFAATFTTVASNSLTAVYAGDATNKTSTSTAKTVSSTKATSTSAVASSLNPSTSGARVTFTASVSGYTPTGNVTFKNGTTTLGTVALSGTGNTRTASFSTTALSIASHSITASYAGNTLNNTSTSAILTQVVNKKATTTTLTSSANPSALGASITLTATVSGGTSPTGTVTFKDGATTLGTGTVTAGKATLAIASLGGGSHSLTAVYEGNTTNATSTSATLAQTVNPKATTTTLASSVNPSTYGGSTTLTATVSGSSSATGTVTFKDGATTLGTGTVSAGKATLAIATLGGGSHSLTAVYAGDTNNASSTSTTLTQTVNKVSTSTSLATNANPAIAGNSVTFTATVTGNTPSGTVTFKDGAATLGTGSVSAGVASFTTASLSAASHSITASYSGDANNASSSSTALSQVITQPAAASTTTTLTATAASASAGSSVSLSATVTSTVSANNPSGQVTFTDGSTVLGSAPLTAGTATLTISTLSVGGHSISASYAGDAANQASTSNNVLLNITPVGIGAMTWKYGYDAMGRPTSTIDPNGQSTYTYYDSLGRPIQTQQPANTGSSTPTVISLQYNLADSVTKVTDPRNLATTYSPDGLGNVTAQSSPDSGASQYTYDAAGNVKTITDARGKVTTLTYDNLDRITRISYSVGTPTTLEYDGGPTPTPAARGELTKITDESGTTSYSFDSAGRLTAKTQTTAAKTFTVRYTWGDSGSALDKLTAITYPSGNKVNYAYDAQGYPTAITVSPVNPNGVGVGSAQNLLSAITTNADSNPTGWVWANGKNRVITYDSFGQIASYSLGDSAGTGTAAGAKRSLIRDAAGRITGFNHTNTASPATATSLNQAFGYDNLNRLVAQTVNGTSTSYVYDATGNRTSKTIGATSYNNTVSPTSNKYTQTQDVTGTAAIQYDAAGHITGDGVNTFTYSDRGRMATASNAGGTVNYLYNAANLRVAKTGPTALVATGASYYVFDENGQLLGEYNSNGAPIYETVYLGMSPVAVLKQTGTAASSNIATTLYNVHADHLATARVITRATDNAIAWRWDTAEAFGGTAPNQDPSGLGTFVYNPRFPGQVFDSETGLFQNWNREYDARQGRYTQSDPIGLNGGLNTYAYVNGNPLSLTDPMGLDPWGTTRVLPSGRVKILNIPSGSAVCTTSTGQALLAAGGVDFNKIYKAGAASGKGLYFANKYVGQEGVYDLQRPTPNTFVEHYADAANYAVGVYMNGAGYGLAEMIAWGKLYGTFKSSNSGANNWVDMWTKGWNDANSGGLCSCVQ